MSTIEWVNGRGETRYQPVLADGRRIYHHYGDLFWRVWENPHNVRIRIADTGWRDEYRGMWEALGDGITYRSDLLAGERRNVIHYPTKN